MPAQSAAGRITGREMKMETLGRETSYQGHDLEGSRIGGRFCLAGQAQFQSSQAAHCGQDEARGKLLTINQGLQFFLEILTRPQP